MKQYSYQHLEHHHDQDPTNFSLFHCIGLWNSPSQPLEKIHKLMIRFMISFKLEISHVIIIVFSYFGHVTKKLVTKDIMWHPITMLVTSSMQLDPRFSSIVLDGHEFSCAKVPTTFVICICNHFYDSSMPKHINMYIDIWWQLSSHGH
jgi:hypothetical protein